MQALQDAQPTVLPALLFLAVWPVYRLLPARHGAAVLGAGSALALLIVAGPALALGLTAAILLSYVLIEGVARLRTFRRAAFVLTWLALHAAYWACFRLPLPAAFQSAAIRPSDRPALFILLSGIGLTFFRLVAYLHDRVRGGAAPLRPADFALYMLYFPQFRHGPIERPHEFAARLRGARGGWTPVDLLVGAGRIALGLGVLAAFGRVGAWVAQRGAGDVAGFASRAFAAPESLSAGELLAFMHALPLALYALASSSASIQLGVSRVFGVRGTENFRYPLMALDPRELWHRWNITLSRWLRDYAYIPLGGARRRRYVNIVLVFVYCGLLHDLQLRALAWGVWTGVTLALYVCIADRCAARRRGAPRSPRGPLALLRRWACRLATFHWFSLGVVIIADPQYCGTRLLACYVRLLVGVPGACLAALG